MGTLVPQEVSYLLLEIAVLLTVVSLAGGLCPWRQLLDPPVLKAAGGLVLLWWVIDLIALDLDLWYFPEGGTLPIRLLGLPVEEYVLFFIHTFICLVLVMVLDHYSPE